MELLYFSDISQLDYVLAFQPDLLKQMRPITGDMVVSFELERLGIEFIDEWDFIEPEEIEKNWNEAFRLSREWWDESLASTKYGGEALTVSAQQDMVYPFEACLNARTVYDRIFSTFPVEKIHGFFLQPVAVIRTGPAPTTRAVRSVSEAVLLFMAEKRGIAVAKLNSSYPLSLGLKKGRRFLSAKINNSVKQLAKEKNTSKKIVLIYKEVMPTSEYAAITEALDNLSDVKVISISQQDLAGGAQFKGMQSNVESRLNIFRNKFIEFSNGYDGVYPEIFSNKHLQFQFERIKSEMETAANNGDVFTALLDSLKPSLVIFGYEALTLERVLVRLAQEKGIYTLGMKHGGVYPMHGMRWASGRVDAMMVWNEIEVKGIESYGVTQSKLTKIGSLQYETDYLQYISKYDERGASRSTRLSKKQLGFDVDKPLILLVTAEISTGFSNPIANPGKHRGDIRDFMALVVARPDLQFVIKPHPSFDYYELYRRLREVGRPNLKFLEQATLSDVIEASDICLMINYCTTASLEAMLHQIPVVYLNNAVYPLSGWRDNLSDTGICRVESMIEMENAIDCLLTNPAVKQHALSEADKQIKEILGVEGGAAASGRFIDFIKGTLDKSGIPKEQGLLSSQTLSDFLYSGDVTQSNNHYSELTQTHSNDVLMYAFAYSAGVNSLGHGSITRIFELCHNKARNGKLAIWNKARWELMLAYIKGSLAKNGYDHLNISNLKFLLPYLVYPHKLIETPVSDKKNIIKYLLLNIFGRKVITVSQLLYSVRKIYFGLIR